MKKSTILCLLITFSACNVENKNVPITSSSAEAKKHYKKADEHEGFLEIDEAEELYEKALKLDSTFAMAHIRLGMLRDDFDKRRMHVQKAMQNIEKLTEAEKLWVQGRNNFYGTQDGKSENECFQELVERYPEDENANYMFGFVNVHHGKSQPDSAIHYFEKAIKINPKIARQYNELAYAYMAKQDFENAENTIKDYIAFLPKHENPRDTYAEMLMRNHRYEESITAYDEVLKINPNAPWAFMGKAANLAFLNRFLESRRVLDNLEGLPLTDYEYRHKWRSRVSSYLVEGKIDSAIVVLNQQKNESASGNNKKEPMFHQYMSLSRITRFYFENNQPDLGLKSYEEWKNFTTNNISRQATIDNVLGLENYFLAFAAVLKNNDDDAIRLLENTQNLSDDMKLLQARLFLNQKNLTQAIAVLETLDETNPYYLHWLSRAYVQNNDEQKSKMVSNKIKSLIETNNLDYALVISEHT